MVLTKKVVSLGASFMLCLKGEMEIAIKATVVYRKLWRLFSHQSKEFYSLHTDIYALKRGKIVYFSQAGRRSQQPIKWLVLHFSHLGKRWKVFPYGIYTLVSLYQNLTHLISDSTISCINTKEANFIWSILYVLHDEYFESVKWEY